MFVVPASAGPWGGATFSDTSATHAGIGRRGHDPRVSSTDRTVRVALTIPWERRGEPDVQTVGDELRLLWIIEEVRQHRIGVGKAAELAGTPRAAFLRLPKEKVTLTLDSERLGDLRRLVGARSLSAAVDRAVAAYVARLRHLAAVDEWLAEMEREHGPIPPETLEWADEIIQKWESGRAERRRHAG